MKIYNSLTRRKEEFSLPPGKEIKIYTCGVTVYDECHLGHARSLYIFDVIRRYLEYKYGKGKVNFVRNITDIDDKIINRANELGTDWKELVDKYIDSYNRDLALLGIRKGMLDKDGEEPRATKNIPDMIAHIKGLIDKGYAYQAGGDVYFNVRKFSEYGKLSGQSIEQMQAGARIEPSEFKKDPLDFALWKKSKENEPSWDSPWSKGRPGWHIECSVMSQKFLKTETLDIHGGGRDLIFPHHENEITQSEALTGKTFARYWIHHGLLTINGQKMAKSLGNFVTIKDALKKYNLDALKIFFLQAHYSSPVDFTWNKMEECKSAIDRFLIFFDKMGRYRNYVAQKDSSLAQGFKRRIELLKGSFSEYMEDDFKTPQALSILFQIIYDTNKSLDEVNLDSDGINLAMNTVKELGTILGLSLELKKEISPYITSKIEERNEARASKNFEKADEIRKELLHLGIILEDGAEGTTWRPV